MKRNIINLLLFVVLFVTNANAQQDSILRQQLRGKQRLTDVMNTVFAYYNDPATIDRLGAKATNRYLKKWSRYEWYMSSRLGPAGEFVNINQKLFDATRSQKVNRTANNTNQSNFIESSSGNWSIVGPANTDFGIGRVDRLAFHPSDPNTVYAGAAGGGLWRTTDAGANWTNLTADIPCLGISGIVIDPNNTNTIYILTGDGDSDISGLVEDFGYMRFSIGVLKSTDGGAWWTRLANFPGVTNALIGYRLTMHPTNSNILFACTSEGLFRTNDGGDSWIGVQTTGGRFYNMKFKPNDIDTCYAVANNGNTARFYRSFNEGVDWETDPAINGQINTPTSRVELAVAASNSNLVYLLCGGVPANGQFAGLFRSTNAGMTFGPQSTTPNILGRSNLGNDNQNQSLYDLTVAVSNTTGATVVSGAIEVWRSTNSGVAWTFRGNLHDDVHDLGFHPGDNKLWAATDGGVYSSIDSGANWTSHFEDMSISQFYRMAVSPADYLEMIAGAQDNGVKKRDNGTSFFDQIGGADGYCVGYDPVTTSTYYAIQNNTLTRFLNDGASNSPLVTNLNFFSNMAVHTSLANTVFLASDSFRTVTNGNVSTYSVVNNNPLGGWYLKTCPSNGNRIYMAGGACPAPTLANPLPGCYQATSGVLRRSDDGGATWPTNNILSNDNGFPLTFPKITSINVDPTNSLKVWVTFGGFTDNVKVYYADYNVNPSGNWINMSGSLPNLPVNCIALDNNNNAYIGTDNGVYYRGTGMSDWVPFYNNLPYVPVTDIVISEADNRIRAATFGRGIWSSDLYTACVTDLNITGTLEGQEFYEASNTITSTASLLTSEGSKVQMRGGNEVLLEAGFSAKETTQFRAAIGPCGSGGVAGFRLATNDPSIRLPAQQYLSPTGGNRSLIHILSC
ncbi:MAG: 3-coathanger stack domain-containing protein, partial [Bacteroidota bacterium]